MLRACPGGLAAGAERKQPKRLRDAALLGRPFRARMFLLGKPRALPWAAIDRPVGIPSPGAAEPRTYDAFRLKPKPLFQAPPTTTNEAPRTKNAQLLRNNGNAIGRGAVRP